jgi:hypothetical protein
MMSGWLGENIISEKGSDRKSVHRVSLEFFHTVGDESMKTENWQVSRWFGGLFLIFAMISACGPNFQTGSDIAQGRQALFRGDYQAALGYFKAAQPSGPDYIFGTELREGVLSYVGRAQYLTGDWSQANQTLERSLAQHKSDNVARLYLGLTELSRV